ncbi:MAG: RecX family transcriptional regulator [Anaerolineaceae bacterium]
MSKISAITPQKRNPNRLSISLDGSYAFSLDRYTAAWLVVGAELSEADVERLLAKDEVESAYVRVMRFLASRGRSQHELEQHLQGKGYAESVRAAVLERLEADGYLNDARFASEWLENRATFRPRSHAQVRAELRLKGISEEIIAETLGKTEHQDEDLAMEAARRAFRQYEKLDWKTFRVKMGNALLRRGFSYSVAQEATKKVWNEIHSSE